MLVEKPQSAPTMKAEVNPHLLVKWSRDTKRGDGFECHRIESHVFDRVDVFLFIEWEERISESVF